MLCELDRFFKLFKLLGPSGRYENDALGGQHGAAVGGQDDAGQVVLPRGQEDKTLRVSGTLMRVTEVFNSLCIIISLANEWV